MEVQLQLFEGNAIPIEIPQRATFEIVDTEPVVKGQTASGSFKPAMLSMACAPWCPRTSRVGVRIVVHDRRRRLCRAGQRTRDYKIS